VEIEIVQSEGREAGRSKKGGGEVGEK